MYKEQCIYLLELSKNEKRLDIEYILFPKVFILIKGKV